MQQSVRAVKPPVRRSPKAGKQKAPEVKGEFSKGNESLRDLRDVIVDLTEYPEVQRNDQDTVKAPLTYGRARTDLQGAPVRRQ
jgi:hypothetical protein